MRTLEANRSFPFIAWTVLILLSSGTLFLAIELKKTADYLGEKTLENVRAINEV